MIKILINVFLVSTLALNSVGDLVNNSDLKGELKSISVQVVELKKIDTSVYFLRGYELGLKCCVPDSVPYAVKEIEYRRTNFHFDDDNITIRTKGDTITYGIFVKRDTILGKGKLIERKIKTKK